jgi:peptide deformylase
LRFFVFNPSGEREIREEERVFINPVIRNRKGSVVGEEGCLSLPNLFGDVRRAETIVIEAFNLEGEELRGTLEDLPARVFQHELDHLDGVLFIDRLSPEGYAERQARLGDMQAAWRSRQAAGEVPPDEEILRRLRVVAAAGRLLAE